MKINGTCSFTFSCWHHGSEHLQEHMEIFLLLQHILTLLWACFWKYVKGKKCVLPKASTTTYNFTNKDYRTQKAHKTMAKNLNTKLSWTVLDSRWFWIILCNCNYIYIRDSLKNCTLMRLLSMTACTPLHSSTGTPAAAPDTTVHFCWFPLL